MRRFLPHIDISLKVETGNRSRNIAGTIGIKAADANDTNIFRAVKFGWGGRIRTFTVLINSEVSYQLDHAPFLFHINMQA
jgi:hypothetical protein